jgi:predicted amidohydrolase YtcJ
MCGRECPGAEGGTLHAGSRHPHRAAQPARYGILSHDAPEELPIRLDALFIHGRFTTLEPARPTASRLGVIGGRIVGFDDDLDGCDAAIVHDLLGAPVVPGFHDAHHHLSGRGQQLQGCDVSPAAAPDLAALYRCIRDHAVGLPEDAWVVAAGFDDSKLDARPTREGLDAAAAGRPVWVTHASHHQGVLSTAGIRRLGFDDPRELPELDGGWVERREDGDPTGAIAERTLELVHDVLRPVPFEDFVHAIGLGADAALAEGLTSITEPGISGRLTGNDTSDLAAFLTARERGRLGVRVTVMPEISALHALLSGPAERARSGRVPGRFGLDLGVRTGLGDDDLRIGGVKLFADGALTSCTARLREDYLDRPGKRGLALTDPDLLRDQIAAAHRAGWQVATHAIGDAAIDDVLAAYEEAQRRWPRTDPRHRIEHCGMTHDEQIARLRDLGVIPVPQARFLTELGDAYVTVLGRERADATLYRQRSFLEAGIELPGSSDCPVVDGAPLRGIDALVNRVLPDGSVLGAEESLTPEQALRAFTLGSAHADHQETRKGSLRVGKLADLVVLGDDLFTVAPTTIGDIEVLATVVGGEVRHGAGSLATTG